MATYTGIGFSQNQNGLKAAQEAADAAKRELHQERIDIAFVFLTAHYDPQEVLPVIAEILDHTKIVGSSTYGLILSETMEKRGIGVMAITSDDVIYETSSIEHLQLQDKRWAGKALAKSSVTDFGQKHRKLFLFFVEGMLEGISGLIDGIKDQFGTTFPLIGAGSSDDLRFESSYQIHKEKVLSHGAVGVLLGGRMQFGISCQHGWTPLGKPRVIDQIDGHIIKTIGGKKAIQLYEEYFGEEAQTLKAGSFGQINIRYPLGSYVPDINAYLLRNVVNVLDDGSVVCQDKVNEKSEVHLMIGNKETCLQATQKAAQDVKDQLNGEKPDFVLIFESLARYKIMGRAALQELRIIKDILGNVPLFGMFSYGEIGTLNTTVNRPNSQLQNGSIIILGVK